MQRLLIIFTTLALTLISPLVFAVEKNKISTDQISLFAKPNKDATVVEKLNPMQHMIPFYRQDGWVKVGIPTDGKVGWVNIKQLRQAREKIMKPRSQMVFVQIEKSNKKGKPSYDIVAYKNGKKLDKKQAQALYDKLAQRQQSLNMQMQQFRQQMQQWFNQGMQSFNTPFFYPGPGPVIQPIIVIEKANDHSGETKAKEDKDYKNTSDSTKK